MKRKQERFESHQSGIEIESTDGIEHLYSYLNRTIVELKCGYDRLVVPRLFRLNRTRVELKFREELCLVGTRLGFESHQSGIEIR